ncbi:PAS domain-containing protein [Segetibacter sp. 3557_3]|uniref:PAS domain-containing protein n=1 Tax=Segetibacter sp. 3557_3 TaxID=2547429 RepID=UPI001404A6B3|nr:PAS domain-containing protein [Segetibacter sp. 3557_3]
MLEKPASLDALTILNNIPGCHLFLLPDAPRFTIAGATNEYLEITYLNRHEAIGQGVFETLSDDPDNPAATGVKSLSASLSYVREHKLEHRMDDQRYDIFNPVSGEFEIRVWSPINKPVFDQEGNVQYIVHTVRDITEKVQLREEGRITGQKLQESKSVLRNMMEQAPVAMLLSTGDDVLIENVNASMLQLMNKSSAEEVLGKTMLEAMPELAGQEAYQRVLNVRLSGIPYAGLEQPVNLLINGLIEIRYFNFSCTPVLESGEITGVLHVAVDVTLQVTTRKEIETAKAEIERQKRLYETINSATPDLIYVFDLAYHFTYANKALLEMWGKTWEMAIGKGLRANGYEEWHAQMHEKEIDYVSSTKTSIRGQVSFPHAVLGKRIYDYIFVPVLNAEGDVEAVAGTTRDITELKKAEELLKERERHLRTLIMQAPTAMCFMLGPDHVVDIANDHIIKLWGKPKEAVMNKPIFEGLPDAKDQGLEKILANVYATGETFRGTEHRVELVRNGQLDITYQNFVYEPYRDSEEKILGIIAITTDVTDQVMARRKIEEIVAQRTMELAQVNESLQHINKELQRSNQNLEEFAHAASHDLKEPIRKIHFFTHRLKEQLSARLEESELRSFNRIENATERMGNLIDDLLLYSHVSQRPHQREAVDLNDKVKRVLEDLELDIEEKGATIVLGKLPIVEGNKRQLQQLFQNLISNALKYSKADVRPQIELISSLSTNDGKPFHRIAVKDNGIGFQPEYANKIFHMFTRLHGKNEYSGTGVGLSIVKKVVENHDGYIVAESTPGKGAVFSVFLPVH